MRDLFPEDWRPNLRRLFLGLDSRVDSGLFRSFAGLRESYERFSTFMDRFHVAGWRRGLIECVSEAATLGTVEGARILDLGCGTGRNAVVLAQAGAKVLGVDPSADLLASARERCDAAEVRVELHQTELAELAFLRSDSIDAAISVMALGTVDDLARVFRQVHRVLKPEAPLVLSVPHPAFLLLDPTASDPLRIARAYDDATPRSWELDGRDVVELDELERIRAEQDVLLRAIIGLTNHVRALEHRRQ